ncbi:MAG: hypothetical protein HGB32_04775 [Geobacteraceae bacterium]|nr:hypothetical protein [Geobacteraceae bacterium]NTW79443.1 hypothetical protein [Geobacteraceae bacterium]
MKFTVRPGLKLALTLLFILAVYFQTIHNPFSRFDDPFIVEHYGINSTISFLDVITPGSGFYYRPLINLSYWLDSRLWAMDATFMHLENIIVHFANVLLVFLIASLLPVSSKTKSVPFLAALLFGLHPINSESVNWIAGRTDVFAGFFVLLAFYCLIRAIQEQSSRRAFFAFAVAFAGTLAKETAIMFIPAALLAVSFWPVVPQDVSRYKIWRTRFLLVPIVVSSCLIVAILVMVYVRGHGNNAVSLLFESGTNIFVRSFEAFGFYAKKLFLPLPLNVAIVEVSSLYAILGIIALSVLVATVRKSGIPGIFLVVAGLFILPALVVATTSITWTPFGERYLYIPSAFAVIGGLELLHRFLARWNSASCFLPIVSIIIIAAAIITFQRGMLWRDNFALIEDIVAKSPSFGVARNEYGILLKQAGRFDEAAKQFKIAAEQKNRENVSRMIRLNLVGMKLLGKQHDEIRRILLSEIGTKADGDVELLKLLNIYDESLFINTSAIKTKRLIVADIIETNENLFLKTRDPHYLYRSGQYALSIGNDKQAAEFFKKTWENASPEAYYREPARHLAEKLGAQ